MTFKPSKLAQLVVAYDAHFRKQVPIEALRILQPVDLVALIQKAIDTNTARAGAGPRLSSSVHAVASLIERRRRSCRAANGCANRVRSAARSLPGGVE